MVPMKAMFAPQTTLPLAVVGATMNILIESVMKAIMIMMFTTAVTLTVVTGGLVTTTATVAMVMSVVIVMIVVMVDSRILFLVFLGVSTVFSLSVTMVPTVLFVIVVDVVMMVIVMVFVKTFVLVVVVDVIVTTIVVMFVVFGAWAGSWWSREVTHDVAWCRCSIRFSHLSGAWQGDLWRVQNNVWLWRGLIDCERVNKGVAKSCGLVLEDYIWTGLLGG